MKLFDNYEVIAPLQKRVDKLKESLKPQQVHNDEGKKWISGEFHQAYRDYEIQALKKGKDVTEIDFIRSILDELKEIQESVSVLENHYKTKNVAIWNDIIETKAFAKKRIEEFTQKESEKPQQQVLSLNKEVESRVLENYQFWQDIEGAKKSYNNIFKDVTQQAFLEMICTADFSSLNKKGISQRVKYNVVILSRLLEDDWGEKAAKKLDTTLRECGKMTNFEEWEKIKSMYSQ